MAGKIFYSERVKSKEGTRSPRFGVVAVGDINLKVYTDHLRLISKNENGLYTDDPKKDVDAQFIAEICAIDLLNKNLDDLVVERPRLEILQNNEVVEKLHVINGIVPGTLTRAHNGEHVGTRIYRQ